MAASSTILRNIACLAEKRFPPHLKYLQRPNLIHSQQRLYAHKGHDPGKVAFTANVDSYNGRIINHDDVISCSSNDVFSQRLKTSLSLWRSQGGARGVWLEIPVEVASFVPIALKHGFEIHHAHKESITLTYWFPGEKGIPSSLPSYNTHTVGVGAAVMNDNGELLVVQERTGPASKLKDFWKIPTGIVHAGEDSFEACEREVFEETGVHISAERLTALREAHVKHRESASAPSGLSSVNATSNVFQTNIFLVFACRPKVIEDSQGGHIDIIKQDHEIAQCRWMDADLFIQSQEKVMPKGSVYYELNRKAVAVARGLYGEGHMEGFGHRSLPFRRGENRVYDPIE